VAKVLVNIAPKRLRWYMVEPEGTPEQKLESYEKAETYLYKLLDYAPRETKTDTEIQDIRRDFAFIRNGPWSGSFLASPRTKLTSADVLYLLTSSLPATEISKKFNVHCEEVKKIRRGEVFSYYREYLFVRRLTTLIKSRLKNNDGSCSFKKAYKISELVGEGKYEDHFHTSSLRRAKAIRKGMITKKEYGELIKKGTLETIYPITEIDIL
jgi:hypothetical protein